MDTQDPLMLHRGFNTVLNFQPQIIDQKPDDKIPPMRK